MYCIADRHMKQSDFLQRVYSTMIHFLDTKSDVSALFIID